MLGITVIDVAKEANVSATTVSLCFQRESRVSDKTRQRVLTIARELGYVPNQFARRLRSGKSRLIGLFVTEVYSSFMAEIIAGVERTVVEGGYNVLVFSTYRDLKIEEAVIQAAAELKVEGIIVAACEQRNETLQRLCENKFPVVYIDSIPSDPACSSVVNDMDGVAKLGTEYLLGLGHRRILLINGQEKSRSFSSFSKMEKTHCETLCKNGIRPDKKLIRYFGASIADGYAAVQSAIEEETDFSAIFAITDTAALGAVECLEAHGIKVPDDVSVLGIDNSEVSALSRIGLSTIETYNKKSNKDDMGVLAANVLLTAIADSENAKTQTIVLKPRLVLRQSCKELSPALSREPALPR